MQTRAALVALALVAVGAASAACSVDLGGREEVIVREEKRFPVTGNVSVVLETFDGAIQVRSWDRNEVLVEVERRGPDQQEAEALELRTSHEGAVIRVEAPTPRVRRRVVGFGSFNTARVDLIVTVPRRTPIQARTGDGPITVDETGAVDLTSGDGSILVERVLGGVKVHTGDGSVRLASIDGTVTAETGDGSVNVEGRFDEVRIHTGDGSIVVSAANGSQVKNDWNITTGDGGIELQLPAVDAELDATSGDGGVDASSVGLGRGGIDRDSDRDGGLSGGQGVRGQLGRGGKVVRLHSGDGRIRVARR